MFENGIICGNQQRSPEQGNVQRLERKLVAPSGAKWDASRTDEDIVWSCMKVQVFGGNMNYEKLYVNFIEKFKCQMFGEDEYTEVHHILPRYAGGTDDEENLVRLTYRQHVFVHKLWWKATGHSKAFIAYALMSKIPENKKQFLCSEAGKLGGAKNVISGHIYELGLVYGSSNGRRNVESGHLDNIRLLANNEERKRKLKLLHEAHSLNGHYEKFTKAGNDAWRGSTHTEEFKEKRSAEYKLKYSDPVLRQQLVERSKSGRKVRADNSEKLSQDVINNSQRNIEFLHKTDIRSKYKFISPEGLIFDSVGFMANYYGCKSYIVDNWCKRNQHGWNRILKQNENSDFV